MSAQRFFPNPTAAPARAAAADMSHEAHRTHVAYPALQASRTRQTSQAARIFRKRSALVVALAAVLLLPAAASAQVLTGGPWTLTSSTADSGGGRSTAGAWTVTGTIGQPDASPAATSGAFAIAGGFWADAAVIPTDNNGPQLTISLLNAASVQLAWPTEAAGWTLQKSTDLTNWTDVQGIPPASAPGSGSWPLSTGPRHFFRLILK